MLLLNHTSKDIVYNSLGIIINCLADLEIKLASNSYIRN